MKYEKPTVLAMTSAVKAIHSNDCTVKSIAQHDSVACGSGAGHATNGAYEADE
jgi:hypothetical protein